jgi:hypothetical protein
MKTHPSMTLRSGYAEALKLSMRAIFFKGYQAMGHWESCAPAEAWQKDLRSDL